MRFSARRGVCGFVLTLLIIILLGFTADAQPVFRGTMTLQAPGVTLFPDFVVTLHPGGPATYELSIVGHHIDSGLITASQSGSAVNGLIISTDPKVGGVCPFTATLSGGTVTGTLLCGTETVSGSFVLTQV